MALYALGWFLVVFSTFLINHFELFGLSQGVAAWRRKMEVEPEFRTPLLYKLVRHPIYLGWALIVFGASPMTVDRAVWALVSTLYLIIAMPWEERSLSAAAGPAYSAYCRRVRWRMVPGVY